MDFLRQKLQNISDLEFIGLKFYLDITKEEKHGSLFYIIGKDYDDKIGLESNSYKLFSISNEELIFINSSLEQLVECIAFFNKNIDFLEHYDEKTRKESIKIISTKFREIDQFAIQENSWWSCILEQVEDGLV